MNVDLYIYVHGGETINVCGPIYMYMMVTHRCMWSYIYICVHGGDPSMYVDLYICTWW